VRDAERVACRLGMWDEDVQLGAVARPDARRGGDVDARVADRRGDAGERARARSPPRSPDRLPCPNSGRRPADAQRRAEREPAAPFSGNSVRPHERDFPEKGRTGRATSFTGCHGRARRDSAAASRMCPCSSSQGCRSCATGAPSSLRSTGV
jgi:hypothetical protein